MRGKNITRETMTAILNSKERKRSRLIHCEKYIKYYFLEKIDNKNDTYQLFTLVCSWV